MGWIVWSGWRDLNSRPLDPQIGLPLFWSVNNLSLVSIVDRRRALSMTGVVRSWSVVSQHSPGALVITRPVWQVSALSWLSCGKSPLIPLQWSKADSRDPSDAYLRSLEPPDIGGASIDLSIPL
jgi:hypothetical protein